MVKNEENDMTESKKEQQNEVEMEFGKTDSISSSSKKIKLKSIESIDSLIKKAHDALEESSR